MPKHDWGEYLKAVGVSFIEFLKEDDQRRSITDQKQLKQIYTNEFRLFRVRNGYKHPDFGPVLHALNSSGKAKISSGNIYFKGAQVCLDQQQQQETPSQDKGPGTANGQTNHSQDKPQTGGKAGKKKPREICEIDVHFHTTQPGVYRAFLQFKIEHPDRPIAGVCIVRSLEVTYRTSLGQELTQIPPAKACSIPPETSYVPTIVKGQRPERLPNMNLKPEVPLKEYNVPDYIDKLMKALNGIIAGSSIGKLSRDKVMVESPLTWKNYSQKLHLLLFLEEVQLERDMKKYNMVDVPLVRDEDDTKLFLLQVSDSDASLLRGQQVLVRPSEEPEDPEGVRYQGFIHHVDEDQAQLSFGKEFMDRFIEGMTFSVEFVVNRLTMRVEHRAVEFASLYSLKEVLFPAEDPISYKSKKTSTPSLFNSQLKENREQYQAIKHIVAGSSIPAPYLVFGPPGTAFTKMLCEKLQAPFSMNIDEATNVNMDKVLNVIVRFFDGEMGKVVEGLCSDLFYDIEKSPKQKEIFREYQSLLHMPPRSLTRPISNRFLQMLEGFLKKLQREKLMVHLLHSEMLYLVREFLVKFLKPAVIPLSAKELVKVDFKTRDNQLCNKRLFVGTYCYSALNKARLDRKIWVDTLYSNLREGYIKAADFLITKLPLTNQIITSLSALAPSMIQEESLCGAFITLGKALPNVVQPEDLGLLDGEIRAYQIDIELLTRSQSYSEDEMRVDVDCAADLLWGRLLDGMEDKDKDKVYRMYAYSHSGVIPQKRQRYCNKKTGSIVIPSKEELMQYKIMVTTLQTASRLVTGGIPTGFYTHIFVDEAGCAPETTCIIPLSGLLNPETGQVVLAGDPKQLGPIIHSCLADKYGMGVSLLERLMSDVPLYKKKMKKDKGERFNKRFITKLLKKYRSHPDILKIPNDLFYEGELQFCADEKMRNSYCGWKYLPMKDFPVIFHRVVGTNEQEADSPSLFNIAEVEVLMDYLKILVCGQRKTKPRNIGIIATYRKQVEKIKKALEIVEKDLGGKNLEDITVGTVEEFQGKESQVILLSTVRSRPKGMIKKNQKISLGFVKNDKVEDTGALNAERLVLGIAPISKISGI
ncbi:putative helicase mov-10-B.1 [Diretmus argenteus]